MNLGHRFTGRARSVYLLASAFAILASLLLLFGPPLRAQAATAGSSRLDGVEVTGSARFHSDQIAPATGLRTGTNVTREDLQAAADRLAKLGLFTAVQYRFTTTDAGVKVTYQVGDAPAVPISFDNFPWFTDEEITAALKNAVVLFDGSAPARGTILDDMSAALKKLLETRNVHATISHALVTSAAGRQVQQFQTDAPELKVGSVEFSDALANGDRGIQTRLSDIVGKPFSRSALETFELEQVRPVYLSRGFLRVQFDPPKTRFAGSAENSTLDKVMVAVPIQPGLAYVWSGVAWKGNSAIPAPDLDEFVKLKPGDPADGIKIEAMWQDVRDAYGKRGFLDAALTPVPQFEENTKHASYAVSIAEGPQYQMGDLILTGLSPDGEKRIRTAWKIASGATFDKIFYDQFLDAGIKQAFAGLSYHYDKIGRFLQEDRKNAKVDVLLDFQ